MTLGKDNIKTINSLFNYISKPIKSISLYEIKQILLFMTFMFPNKTKARLTEPVI